jgi:hypothetical protein
LQGRAGPARSQRRAERQIAADVIGVAIGRLTLPFDSVVVTPVRSNQRTLDCARRRKAEGNGTLAILRCRNLMIESAREIVANDPIFRIPRGR